MTAAGEVTRNLNDTRIAVFGILVSIALTFAFGVSDVWYWQLAGGIGSLAATVALLRPRRSRTWVGRFMYWLVGR